MIAGSAHAQVLLGQQLHLTIVAGKSLDDSPAAIGRAVINDKDLVIIGPQLLIHNGMQTPQHIVLGVV
jgi:hypothetical protein